MNARNPSNITVKKKPLVSYIDTVSEIKRIAFEHFRDLTQKNKFNVNLGALEPWEFFDFIQDIEYVRDPQAIEFLSRPKIALEMANLDFPFDCDDRTILSLSYFHLRNYINVTLGQNPPFQMKIMVVGRYTTPHHVYLEYRDLSESDKWIPFDPTYPHNVYGEEPFPAGFKKEFLINHLQY